MDLFYQLEGERISSRRRNELAYDLVARGILVENEFTNYLRYRLSNGMTLISFHNLIENVFGYSSINSIVGDAFVDLLSSAYLKGNFLPYFQHIISCHHKNDVSDPNRLVILDILMRIVHRTIYHISHDYNLIEALQRCMDLSKETSISYPNVLFWLGEQYYKKGDRVHNLLMIDSLELPDRYNLLAIAVKSNSQVAQDLEESLAEDKFFEYAQEVIHDEDHLCKSIRSINLRLRGNHLKRLLTQSPQRIPKTLNHILEVAVNNLDFDIVIQLGSCFPKKKILEIITAQNDYELLDKFFFLYKDYPEIKKLAPFI